MSRPASLRVLGLTVLLAACGTTGPRHDALQAVLWVRSAAEYEAVARQAYRTAHRSLRAALADPTWTAALEQPAAPAGLPPAVIVDVDETVLDNAVFDARLVREGREFDPAEWEAWVAEAAAPPVPGALEFLRAADSLGVRIFYVTNRDAPQEEGTRRNLLWLGFPVDPGRDVVLTRGEREGWGSDKSSRRAEVAREHRVVLVIGDDLNDFVFARVPPAERRALAERHRERWGDRWIILPNPVYGSWEDALWGFRDADPGERHRIRLRALETDPATTPEEER